MSKKEMALKLIDNVPEYMLGYVIAYIQGILAAEETEIPNAETLDAMEKAAKGEDMIGPFDTVEELMQSLNAPDKECDHHEKT